MINKSNSRIYFLVLGIVLLVCKATGCPEIVTRASWGARAPKSSQTMTTPVKHVFIHHTAGATCANKDACMKVMRQTQNYHMDSKNWADIGYSFLVGGEGMIYEGRGWNKVGAHTRNYNSKAIAISFMGNFESSTPSATMINAARKLIDCGVQKGYISSGREIHGHRDASCTACPGQKLYDMIKTWPGFKGGRLSGYVC